MVRRTGPTNDELRALLAHLQPKAKEGPFWQRVLEDVQKPTRQRREVNIYKIEQYAQEGEMVLVPGKVLSVGELHKKVTVAALTFSAGAKQKITAAKGKTLSIGELFRQNPEGRKVRILG